jgi:hypothetical protein
LLQCDVRQFFPAIDHEILDYILARKLDEEVLWLCRCIMHGGGGLFKHEYRMVYFPGDDLFAAARPRGLPIGNLTSQFWLNVYLNTYDLLRWLIPLTIKFPRQHRFVLAAAIQRCVMAFQEHLIEAGLSDEAPGRCQFDQTQVVFTLVPRPSVVEQRPIRTRFQNGGRNWPSAWRLAQKFAIARKSGTINPRFSVTAIQLASFPRKRESITVYKTWIPIVMGMTKIW